MRKKSPTLVCRLSTSLTTKTLEHVVQAYNLPRGLDRGEVAEAAQVAEVAEAVEAVLVLAAMVVAAAGSELAHNPVRLYLSSSGRALLTHARGTADRGEHRKAAGAFADIACRQLIQINAYCLNFVNRSYWKVLLP
jgi:hypothetical protein